MSRNGAGTNPSNLPSIGAGLEEILRQSCRLMARRGFHGTSIRELAQETGRSLAGLYHYFRSKEDLLFLINYHGFSTLNETWAKIDDNFEPHERIYAFIYFHTRYFVEHIDEMRVMTWGTQELEVKKARIIHKLKDRYTRAARDVVSDVYQATTGRAMEDKRLSRETYILFGMMNWIFGWYSSRKHGNVNELVGDIYCTFLNGLSDGDEERKQLDQLNGKVEEWFKNNGAASMWQGAAQHTQRRSKIQ